MYSSPACLYVFNFLLFHYMKNSYVRKKSVLLNCVKIKHNLLIRPLINKPCASSTISFQPFERRQYEMLLLIAEDYFLRKHSGMCALRHVYFKVIFLGWGFPKSHSDNSDMKSKHICTFSLVSAFISMLIMCKNKLVFLCCCCCCYFVIIEFPHLQT